MIAAVKHQGWNLSAVSSAENLEKVLSALEKAEEYMALTDNFSGKVGLGWVSNYLEFLRMGNSCSSQLWIWFLAVRWDKNCFFPQAGQQFSNAQAGCINPGRFTLGF